MTPKQERAVRTRSRLVLSAAEAFDRQGFAVASLTAISRSAGVSNGALHFHFESKEALAVAVETEAVGRVRAAVDDSARPGISALQVLVDATHVLTQRLREDVVVRAGFRLGGDAARGVGSGLPVQWHRSVVRLVDRARLDGSLTSAVTPSDAAAAVAAVVLGSEVLARFDPAWLGPDLVAGFWDLLLPRLAAGPVERGQLDSGPAGFGGPPASARPSWAG
ncbi:ScbR family autoregulator-binding transcription factor [Kitasatospora sp. NPDC048540]|uniref:ScbR family autoregulator-binding transcription factor n=1 Tax=unclassified Kitasatospora TaxID=2633591 RepID=UPI0006924575|nr:ScbR family autoregulator-binding transcription factor [Kitasatospora sp. MBT63]